MDRRESRLRGNAGRGNGINFASFGLSIETLAQHGVRRRRLCSVTGGGRGGCSPLPGLLSLRYTLSLARRGPNERSTLQINKSNAKHHDTLILITEKITKK